MEIFDETIDCLDLNKRTYNALKKSGLVDLKKLVIKTESDILKLPEIGYGSLKNLTRQLKKRNLSLGMSTNSKVFSCQETTKPKIQSPNLSLNDLGLSKREQNCLESEKIYDLKSLVIKPEFSLLRIPNFGKGSLSSLKQILGQLGLKLGMGLNEVQWVNLSFEEEISFISKAFISLPKAFEKSDNFGESLGNFIDQYPEVFKKESHRVIFRRRIACKTKVIPSLEAVGKELEVTRERIRQIEKKIITDLVKLIFGRYVLYGKYRIDKDFFSYWEKVSESFQGQDEVTFSDFINNILAIWNVSFENIQAYFNFISVVFTGKVKSYLTTQNQTYLADIYPLKLKCQSFLNLKISDLRMKKGTKAFSEEGYLTIGDFLKSTSTVRASYCTKLVSCLKNLELDKEGLIDWDAYIASNNFEIIGKDEYLRHADFLEELNDIIIRILGLMDLWTHSLEIFKYRTSRHPKNRPTLMDAADKILGKSAHGPHIARIQSYFLEKLRLILLNKDYSFANFWISKGVIKSISLAEEIYSLSNSDFDKFEYLIRMRWGVNPEPDSISVLWTLIDGYTPERYFHLQSSELKKRRKITSEKKLPEMVRLSGFRDVF